MDDWTGRLADEIGMGGSIRSCYHLIRDQLVLVVPRAHRAADPGEARPTRPALPGPEGSPGPCLPKLAG